MPSRASAVPALRVITSEAWRYASSSGRSRFSATAGLPIASVSPLADATRLASASAASSSWSCGTTRFTSPHERAVAASMGSPVRSSSMARVRPTARATSTIGVVQNSPMRTPGVANMAASEATARSQAATSWQPAAVARPCTRATTGCGVRWIRSITSVHASNTRRWTASSPSVISRRS